MANANVTISGQVTGLPTGSKFIGPFTINNTTSVGAVTELSTASGDNTVTIPTNAIGCVIEPPTTNTAALKLKGAGGDTGIQIAVATPSLYTFPAGTASFILNAGSAGLAIEISWF